MPGYGRVRYRGLYPGIDLVYRSAEGALEYDFVVAPGAHPERISLAMKGAERLSIDRRGDLILHTGAGKVRQRRPFVYQQTGRARKQVPAEYVLKGRGRVAFRVGSYDRARPLVIDPVLAYSTYLGGSGADEGIGLAVDRSGHAYVTGTTESDDFPSHAAVQPKKREFSDAFVTKFDPGGSLIYSTYLGGSGTDSPGTGTDTGLDVAVDSSGSAYVTGYTNSTDFPTKNGAQTTKGGGNCSTDLLCPLDAYVAKLNQAGSAILYASYLGGANMDEGRGIAVDSAGGAYLSGLAFSEDLRTTANAFQPTKRGDSDGFVAKFDTTASGGQSLVYSTYLGGESGESAEAVAVDSSANAYITGLTHSIGFPTVNPAQLVLGGDGDAFVAKLNAAGSALSYSTYLGGNSIDGGKDIALDSSGNAYVSGQAWSLNFPTTRGAYQPSCRLDPNITNTFPCRDAFVAKVRPTESGSESLRYSTYLGGTAEDLGNAIAVDTSGDAYVAGMTRSKTDFPTKGPVQAVHGGGNHDAFLTRLRPSATAADALVYSTYLGGSGEDLGIGVAVDPHQSAYAAGITSSANFPTVKPVQAGHGGFGDAFVTKVSPRTDLSINKADAPDPVVAGQELTYNLTLHNAGPDVAESATVRDHLPGGVIFVSASSGCSEAAGIVTCELGRLASGGRTERQIVVRPIEPNPALSNTALVEVGGVDSEGSNNSATVTTEVRSPPASAPGIPSIITAVQSLGAEAIALASEARRASALRSCLAAVGRPAAVGRRVSVRQRAAARRRAAGRRRCLKLHGRTPGRVTGLSARRLSSSKIALTFNAPGTDGSHPPAARSYLVKQSSGAIRGARRFARARTLCKGSCRFSVTWVGTRITMTVTGLRPRSSYFYAVAARDNVSGRLGPRSQTVKVKTG